MTIRSSSFYRIVFAKSLPDILTPARNSEGRFHHDGEPALYTSCTPEGARLALGYYARPEDPPRLIVKLNVTNANLFDLGDKAACSALSINYDDATVRWQNERAIGALATPWKISDVVRKSGADGMFFPSSSRPDLFHMVLFRWNFLGGAVVRTIGQPQPCDLS